MNRSLSVRRGSALLVVLGMIAFMVISAVAFSAYMRYSRMPSSYLRRTSSSRHLAHAAMANAIDYIDVSIGSNPHPGLGSKSSVYDEDSRSRVNGQSENRNWWRDHCFIGTNQLVEADETVSVLTLEALAYLPPSLINEARYYSRHTPTARWHDFGYDSGRYAFFAVDVSDYLNVNRVPADFGRSSADNRKFTLAYALEDSSHKNYVVQPSQWDDFMEDYANFDALRDNKKREPKYLPFVSLADLNLAVYYKNRTLAQYTSPFCSFIDGSLNLDNLANVAGAETMRNLNIITDSYSQPTSGANADTDLSKTQPFTSVPKGQTQPSNREILQRAGTGVGRAIEENMTAIDMISLYDYLDENDIPASLALPSVERVPMICGLQPALQLTIKPIREQGTEEAVGAVGASGEGTFKRTDKYKLEVSGVGALGVLTMFPFCRDKDVAAGNPTLESAVRIGFGVDNPKFRVKSDSPYVVQNSADFTANGGVEDCMIKPKITTASGLVRTVAQPTDALTKKDMTMNFSDVRSWFQNNEVFSVTVQYVKTAPPGGGMAVPGPETVIDAGINTAFHPVNGDGKGDGGFTVDVLKNDGSVKVRPYMTVAVRVTKNGKTVDLVPASGEDDKKYNSINTDLNIVNIGGGKSNQPIMTFVGDKEIEFSRAAFEAGQQVQVMIQPTGATSVYCPDPRWNFAPENFVRTSAALQSDQGYLDKIGVGQEGRDDDIFMFAGNQGYMQSVSELAFLPRTSVDFGGGKDTTGDCEFTYDRNDFELCENCNNLNGVNIPHGKLMWRTYRLYKKQGYASDDLYKNLGIFDGGTGPRISPYTDSDNVIMAALANTPYDWWAASTNNQDKTFEDLSAKDFNKDYAFNEQNAEAKFAWKDLQSIAAKLKAAMRNDPDGDWEKGWNDLDWAGENNDLVGVDFTDTDELYEIDRKFLYGYWRDCFAVRQQLFMLFVRAEPMMMGGGAVGQTPPQLGARAMALVWRDPFSSSSQAQGSGASSGGKGSAGGSGGGATNQNRPHRTRVLFYRQFD